MHALIYRFELFGVESQPTVSLFNKRWFLVRRCIWNIHVEVQTTHFGLQVFEAQAVSQQETGS